MLLSMERNDPPGKPGAFEAAKLLLSTERNDPPGKPGAFERGEVWVRWISRGSSDLCEYDSPDELKK